MNQPKIYVIGAGISGLIAAQTLEKNGFSPTILESPDPSDFQSVTSFF